MALSTINLIDSPAYTYTNYVNSVNTGVFNANDLFEVTYTLSYVWTRIILPVLSYFYIFNVTGLSVLAEY